MKTWDGWAYLATVIDLHSRTVVGWAIADHMRTELVTAALDMAIANRRPHGSVNTLINTGHHAELRRAGLTRASGCTLGDLAHADEYSKGRGNAP